MPSIYVIQSYMQALAGPDNVYSSGIESARMYYVLNPDDNLPSTESIFSPILSRCELNISMYFLKWKFESKINLGYLI